MSERNYRLELFFSIIRQNISRNSCLQTGIVVIRYLLQSATSNLMGVCNLYVEELSRFLNDLQIKSESKGQWFFWRFHRILFRIIAHHDHFCWTSKTYRPKRINVIVHTIYKAFSLLGCPRNKNKTFWKNNECAVAFKLWEERIL